MLREKGAKGIERGKERGREGVNNGNVQKEKLETRKDIQKGK